MQFLWVYENWLWNWLRCKMVLAKILPRAPNYSGQGLSTVITDQRSLSLEKQRAAPAQTLSFLLQWTESRCKVNFKHLKQGPPKKNLYQYKCTLYRENSHRFTSPLDHFLNCRTSISLRISTTRPSTVFRRSQITCFIWVRVLAVGIRRFDCWENVVPKERVVWQQCKAVWIFSVFPLKCNRLLHFCGSPKCVRNLSITVWKNRGPQTASCIGPPKMTKKGPGPGVTYDHLVDFNRLSSHSLKGYSSVNLIYGLNHRETVLDSLSRDQVSRPLIYGVLSRNDNNTLQ